MAMAWAWGLRRSQSQANRSLRVRQMTYCVLLICSPSVDSATRPSALSPRPRATRPFELSISPSMLDAEKPAMRTIARHAATRLLPAVSPSQRRSIQLKRRFADSEAPRFSQTNRHYRASGTPLPGEKGRGEGNSKTPKQFRAATLLGRKDTEGNAICRRARQRALHGLAGGNRPPRPVCRSACRRAARHVEGW